MNFAYLTQDAIEDFLIELCLLALILFSPLIYGGITISPLSAIETISLFLLFILLLKYLFKEKIYFIRVPALFYILGFLLLVAFQLVYLPKGLISFLSPAVVSLYKGFKINPLAPSTLSICPELTLHYFLQILSYAAVFFVVLNYIDTEKKARRLILVVIVCGFIYSLYGIMMRQLNIMPETFSTFTNRNHFAAYLEMIVFLCISYSLCNLSRPIRIVFVFMASVMILAVFLTASRAGRICFFFSFLVFLLLLKIKRPVKKTISLIIILLLFFSFFVAVSGPASLMQRMDSLSDLFKAYSSRFNIAKDSLMISKDFPIFGTGLGTFTEIAQKYKANDWQVTYGFSHNEPMQLLVEVGGIGFLLILLFFFNYFKNTLSLWYRRNSPFVIYITLGCLVGAFSIILHSFFEFMFHVPAVAILFFIILALAYRVVYLKEPQSLLSVPKYEITLPKFLRISFIVALSLLLIFVGSLILRQYLAASIFEKIKEKKITESGIGGVFEYKRILKSIDKAIALNPLNSSYLNKKADLIAEIALREDTREELRSSGDFTDAIELLYLAEKSYEKAIDLNPAKADYHLRLGWLYSVLGNSDLSEKEFNKALLLDPQNETIKSYIAQYLNVAK